MQAPSFFGTLLMARGTYRSGPDFKHYHVKDERDKRRARILLIVEIAAVILAAWLFVFFFGHRTVADGDAMSPTIEEGDTVLINRLFYRIVGVKRDDIAAVYLDGDTDGTLYVRRIVGIPGDTIQIIDGVLYCNEEEVELASEEEITVAGLASDAITLGEDEYFMIGDSPNSSHDSRYANIGTISKREIYGTIWLRILPLNRIGLTG